jgi:prophage regulatory protein
MIKSIRLVPRIEVQRLRGSNPGGGHSKLYAEIADGLWPPFVKFGTSSLQPEHEVNAMLAAIVAGATDDERRQLVKRLVEERKTVCASFGVGDAPAAQGG